MIELGIASVASLVVKGKEREVGHNTNECMHLKRHIEELIKAGKLSHDHRKAKSEKNSSSSVNSSQNVKIPSSRRNTHSTEQHDNPTRIHDGLWTGSTTFQRHSGCKIKNQSGSSSGIPRADNCNRLHPNRGRTKGIVQMNQTQPRHIRLETLGDDGGSATLSETSCERPKRMPSEKSPLFFKTLKKCMKKSDFQWTMKAEATLKQMKKLLAELPTLTEPIEKEELIAYLVAASYFIVKRPEYDSLVTTTEVKEDLLDPWILFMDGSSCIDGSGTGLILTNPEGIEFTYALRFRFDATNNEAKYKALIAGLRIAEQMGIKNLQANAHRTMIKSSNEDTPFSLTYRTKAVIPVEIGMPTLRTVKIDMVQNDEALKINLDLLEEKREQAAIREVRSKTKMEKYYNSNFVTQALNQEVLCTGTMMPTMQKIAGSLALSGKDRMK
uniref:Reverse transcriptase domain-containing protein n=1 Tax=Tanacetum cinerariifolium TaxID=118510 RepID=A0A6L2N4N4_TANCI|nr:reverse transcriptase domain-containing protein [Tanacetum cinerariifolium]